MGVEAHLLVIQLDFALSFCACNQALALAMKRVCLIIHLILSAAALHAQQPNAATDSLCIEKRPLFALKTNLLLDAVAAPNLELEVPIARNRYSIMAEYWFPWYVWDNNSKAYQFIHGGIEARRWLGRRCEKETLHGHFISMFAGGGKYDLEWESEGFQGDSYLAAGIGYGYSFRLNRSFRLETSIGIGYMKTGYKYYIGMHDDKFLVWQHNGEFSYIGPVKAKISLSWVLFRKVRKEGGR